MTACTDSTGVCPSPLTFSNLTPEGNNLISFGDAVLVGAQYETLDETAPSNMAAIRPNLSADSDDGSKAPAELVVEGIGNNALLFDLRGADVGDRYTVFVRQTDEAQVEVVAPTDPRLSPCPDPALSARVTHRSGQVVYSVVGDSAPPPCFVEFAISTKGGPRQFTDGGWFFSESLPTFAFGIEPDRGVDVCAVHAGGRLGGVKPTLSARARPLGLSSGQWVPVPEGE